MRVSSRWALLALVAAAAVGCSYSLPLGGVAVGRGRPIPAGSVRVGSSVGRRVDLAGTLPEVLDASAAVVNPVPHADSLTTSAGGLDILGGVVGVADVADIGLSTSRGLHAVVRLAGGNVWAASLSPAVHTHSSRDPAGVPGAAKARVTNVNLTGLLSVDPWPGGSFLSDAYAGAGLTRFGGWISAEQSRRSGDGVVPSVLAGIQLGGPRCLGRCLPGDTGSFSLGLEAQGTWVTQRSGRHDFVSTVRLYFALDLRARS